LTASDGRGHHAEPADRPLYEQAIAAAQRYKTAAHDTAEEAWAQVLAEASRITKIERADYQVGQGIGLRVVL
jgi:hypothetical protein